jgi:glyoxylase-like metal-dependent hydrolase (beta-lactamase superfamily II)
VSQGDTQNSLFRDARTWRQRRELDSVIAYVERDLADQLPSDQPILAVCAKGDTSEYVAQGLRHLGYASANLKGGMKAWGEHYATRALVEGPDLAIYQVSRPARGCLSYVVASAGKAIVIDPLRHLHPYLGLAGGTGLAIEAVVDTHGHADHISGGVALAAKTGAPYYLHPYDAIHPIDLLPAAIPYEIVREGQTFPVGRHELTALHVPGHTLGLIAFQLDDQYLFSGDSIFIRSIARPDLGGKAETWAPLHGRSLRRLLDLPGQTTVLPGHFSSLDEADETGGFAACLDDLRGGMTACSYSSGKVRKDSFATCSKASPSSSPSTWTSNASMPDCWRQPRKTLQRSSSARTFVRFRRPTWSPPEENNEPGL